MIRHYFKLARRGLLKHKYYTLINVFGLVAGVLSALIITKYLGGAFQFDRHHEHKDRIYALSQEESVNDGIKIKSEATYQGLGDQVRQYPEVLQVARYNHHLESLVLADLDSGDRRSYHEKNIFYADSGFLKIFSFPLRYGDRGTALSRLHSIVLSGPASRRYFGAQNPLGKTLTIRVPWGAETSYEVTGVLEDIPQKTQFQFDFLISLGATDPNESWIVPDGSTFVLLKNRADIGALSAKMTTALHELPPLKSTHRKVWVSMDPLTKVQWSGMQYLLMAAGLFILIISWVNYINQVIAQSYWRMKETGVFQVLGATRLNLKKQFMVESGLIGLISLVLVLVLYRLFEPALQSFTNGQILPLIGDPTPINVVFLGIFIGGSLLAAAIPAIILFSSRLGPGLRNIDHNRFGSTSIRQGLVVLQFSMSTILMISVLVISSQLKYMKDKDKGMEMENVLIVRAPIIKDTTWVEKRKTVERFKKQCEGLPFVLQAVSSTTVPSEEYRQETYLSLQGSEAKYMVHQNGVDDRFFDLYAIKFAAGGPFIPNANHKNRNSIILNESAARGLGLYDFANRINTRIVDHESGEVYDLIGIVRDYHQTSLKYSIRPIAFKFNPFRGHFSLKMKEDGPMGPSLERKLADIRQIWEKTYPDASFEPFFLDEKFAAQDREDHYFGKGFGFFTLLSIVISCLGLFGLSLLISNKRQREIGVRKVFGASALDILLLFLRGYLGPLVLALLLGTPIAYLLMNSWLRNFAYKIDLGLGLMSLAWLALSLIFLMTVSFHTLKSSIANPVATLRD
ncbi:MAG TPA: ABC transporter permease [Saprospiraceae bacterium]|nr:ABC transporter permease [Saprospiraceae bacterium]